MALISQASLSEGSMERNRDQKPDMRRFHVSGFGVRSVARSRGQGWPQATAEGGA
jgi:hypothetical protein